MSAYSDLDMPTFTVSGGVSDVTGPEIEYVEASDDSAVSGDEVYMYVGFSDDSAMDRISLGVKNPGGSVQYFNCYDDSSSGECEFTLTIGEGHFTQAGEYSIDNVQGYDEHGNSTVELSAYSDLDMPTFTVSGGISDVTWPEIEYVEASDDSAVSGDEVYVLSLIHI